MNNSFFCGIVIGLIFGMPAGAVGAMTVQRTLHYGMRAGLLTGLGSSVADCFYACIGAFGLTLISDFLLSYQNIINVLGGSLVLFMGIRMLLVQKKRKPQETAAKGGIPLFLSSLAVGITNPAAILTFLFAFSWFGLSEEMGILRGIQLVAGVFIGTYLWWGSLSAGVCFLKKNVQIHNLNKLNRIFGIILIVFGLVVFAKNFVS